MGISKVIIIQADYNNLLSLPNSLVHHFFHALDLTDFLNVIAEHGELAPEPVF